MFLGCGNIGSRLLQSVVQVHSDCMGGHSHIHICEPNDVSRTVALERARQAGFDGGDDLRGSTCTLHFHHSIEAADVKEPIDLVIVPTRSDIRFELAKQAIEKFQIRKILFEKFLFQEKAHYAQMQSLMDTNDIEAWVHTSRNEAPGYNQIKDILRQNDGPVHMTVTGGGYALASNAIHFLALYNHLTEKQISETNMSACHVDEQGNKRSGYAELSGTIRVYYDDGGSLTLTDYAPAAQPITIAISNPESFIVVDEGKQAMRMRRKADNWEWKEQPMNMVMASGLAGIFESIISDSKTTLPTYEQATRDHIALIEAYCSVLTPDDKEASFCPVT